jgi:hypothetical protein
MYLMKARNPPSKTTKKAYLGTINVKKELTRKTHRLVEMSYSIQLFKVITIYIQKQLRLPESVLSSNRSNLHRAVGCLVDLDRTSILGEGQTETRNKVGT